jgi:hypothetical protein
MKKIISLITMVAMLAVSAPAVAGDRHRDYRWGNDRNHHSPYHSRHHHNGRINTGEAIAIVGGIAILGALISNNNNRREERVIVERREVCQDIVRTDRYGNAYVAGRTCWYEQ